MNDIQMAEKEFGLLDHVPIGVFVLQEDFVVLFWNSCLEDWTGISRSEVIGKNVGTLFPHLNDPKYIGRLRSIFEGGPPTIFSSQLHEYIIPSPLRDGRLRIQHTTVTSVPALDGAGFYALFAIQDVTDLTRRIREYRVMHDQAVAQARERERAEEQLQRYAAELEQSNEEIKQFTYIVSHDLRAPLANLKGFAYELRSAMKDVRAAMNEAVSYLNEEQRLAVTTVLQDVPEILGFIGSSVNCMDSFINALLELARLGHRDLTLELLDMDALVQTTLETLAHRIEERQVEVTVAPMPQVVADQVSMEQILGNLLTNAVLYLDHDRPGEIEITAERGDDATTFRVRDNGCGIEEQDMAMVFAPFRRAGQPDVPGEGMGLAYVQALVRRHNGCIWCESEPGVGTTFTFTVSNHLGKGDEHV